MTDQQTDAWDEADYRRDGDQALTALAASIRDYRPTWAGTVLERCIRDVALGRIAAHSSVTEEMVAEWKRLNPGRAATHEGGQEGTE